MYVIVWRFTARPGSEAEFEARYRAGGDWDVLFRKSGGFIGTELLRPAADTPGYLTIDRWRNEEAFSRFLEEHKEDYAALDARCEELTREEVRIGTFLGVAPDR
jgi:heme-degrading monooxygenase HmoA